jgi:PHD/YefM family antitoxin component YafN of YafNO toxin-antitoxin module
MKVYTYTEARQKLADLLDRAGEEGEVVVRRRDGREYIIQPRRAEASPLDVLDVLDIEPVEADLSREEIVQAVRESRERRASGTAPQ